MLRLRGGDRFAILTAPLSMTRRSIACRDSAVFFAVVAWVAHEEMIEEMGAGIGWMDVTAHRG